jgi:hypothetical protein
MPSDHAMYVHPEHMCEQKSSMAIDLPENICQRLLLKMGTNEGTEFVYIVFVQASKTLLTWISKAGKITVRITNESFSPCTIGRSRY